MGGGEHDVDHKEEESDAEGSALHSRLYTPVSRHQTGPL